MDLNSVSLGGRLTAAPELRQTKSGHSVCDVSIAVNRMKEGETDFVDVTLWGKQAVSLAQYLTKGRHVMIEGRLKLNSWETDEGVKRSKLTIVAESVNLTPNGGGKANSQQTVKAGAGAGASDDMPF